MSEIIITSQFRLIIERSIECYFDNFIKKGVKISENKKSLRLLTESDYDSHRHLFSRVHYGYFDLTFKFETEKKHHEDCCEDSDSDDYDHKDCYDNCKEVLIYYIYLHHKETQLECFKFTENSDINEALLKIKSIEDTYKLCPCDKLALKNKNWCESCYIYRSNHPDKGEVCAICHEDEGRYIRTTCKQSFHGHCFKKIEQEKQQGEWFRKCPLCRTMCNYSYFN